MRKLVVLLMGLVSCAAPSRPKLASGGGPAPDAVCRVSGTSAVPTLLRAEAGHAIARTSGLPVGVTLRPRLGKTVRATFSSPPQGSGVHVEAHVEARDVPLRLSARVAAVPDHLWIAAGAPVSVVSVGESTVQVAAASKEGLGKVVAEVPCVDVVVGTPALANVIVDGKPFHPRGKELHLFSTPSAPSAVALLVPPSPELVTVWAVGSSGDRRHVVYEDWIAFDAWVPETELLAGEGGDCDDCGGALFDAEDSCGGQPSDDGCPDGDELVKVRKETPLHATPGPDGEVIGWVDLGAEVYVFDTVDDYTRIGPRDGGLRLVSLDWPPPDQKGFWIRSDAL